MPKGDKISRKRKSKQQKIILLATSGDEGPIDEDGGEEIFDVESEHRRSLMLPSIISRNRIAKEQVSRSITLPERNINRTT